MSALVEVWVSQASANQRAGRAGRVRNGCCYRMYSDREFKSFKSYQSPEIIRVSLESLCLQILDVGSPHIQAFLEHGLVIPPKETIMMSIQLLIDLGAIISDNNSIIFNIRK